jgi:hypothetical protein
MKRSNQDRYWKEARPLTIDASKFGYPDRLPVFEVVILWTEAISITSYPTSRVSNSQYPASLHPSCSYWYG